MEQFLTWDVLKTYASFVSIVFMVVEFTKELKFVKKIPTKYWSFFISFVLLVITNIVMNSFSFIDIFLYLLTSISISLGSNGLSNFNAKNEKKQSSRFFIKFSSKGGQDYGRKRSINRRSSRRNGSTRHF